MLEFLCHDGLVATNVASSKITKHNLSEHLLNNMDVYNEIKATLPCRCHWIVLARASLSTRARTT